MAAQHGAVDRHPAARIDQHRVADLEVVSVDVADGARPAHRDRARQEVEKVPDGPAAPRDRHALQDLRDQHEQGDDQSGEELADRRGGDDRDAHGQLHGHPPLGDVLERLLADRPTTDQQAGDADHADGCDRLPHAEPDQRRGERDHADAQRLPPLEGVLMLAIVFIVIVVAMSAVRLRLRRRRSRSRLSLIGKRGGIGSAFMQRHGGEPSSLFQVGADDVDELSGAARPLDVVVMRRIGEVDPDVILHHLGHQAIGGSADRYNELHDLGASRLGLQRALDRLHLAAETTNTVQQLAFLFDRVTHQFVPYSIGGIVYRAANVNSGGCLAARWRLAEPFF